VRSLAVCTNLFVQTPQVKDSDEVRIFVNRVSGMDEKSLISRADQTPVVNGFRLC
jgi:hypothetical protein